MKKLTRSVDEHSDRLVCIAAAERNTRVSALVRAYLSGLARPHGEAPDSAQSLFSALDRAQGFRAADCMSRDQAHDRR